MLPANLKEQVENHLQEYALHHGRRMSNMETAEFLFQLLSRSEVDVEKEAREFIKDWPQFETYHRNDMTTPFCAGFDQATAIQSAKVETLKESNAEYIQQLQKAGRDVENLIQERGKLNLDLTTANAKVQSLEAEVKKLNEENTRLVSTSLKQSQFAHTREAEIEHYIAQRSSATNLYRDSQHKLAITNYELDSVNNEKIEFQSELQSLRDRLKECDELRNECELKRLRINELLASDVFYKANLRISELEDDRDALKAENEHFRIANLRSVDAAYHSLLAMSAWLGIPEKKRQSAIEEQMENVRFCADVKNQKQLIDHSMQQAVNKIKNLESKLAEAHLVIKELAKERDQLLGDKMEAVKALEFYADKENWGGFEEENGWLYLYKINDDGENVEGTIYHGGKLARETLARLKGELR